MGSIENEATAGYETFDLAAYGASIGEIRRVQAIGIVAAVHELGTKPGGRWVDVGCGAGLLLEAARASGLEVTGVDPDPVACSLTETRVPGVELHQSVLTESVLADGYADVLSTLDVLEHVPAVDLVAFASLVHRKLSPSGIWVIKVPTSDGLVYLVAGLAGRISQRLAAGALRRLWLTEYQFPHRLYFNERSLRTFLEANGFRVARTQYLPEIYVRSALARVRWDPTVSLLHTIVAVPLLVGISVIDRIRRRSDALLMVAQRI